MRKKTNLKAACPQLLPSPVVLHGNTVVPAASHGCRDDASGHCVANPPMLATLPSNRGPRSSTPWQRTSLCFSVILSIYVDMKLACNNPSESSLAQTVGVSRWAAQRESASRRVTVMGTLVVSDAVSKGSCTAKASMCPWTAVSSAPTDVRHSDQDNCGGGGEERP